MESVLNEITKESDQEDSCLGKSEVLPHAEFDGFRSCLKQRCSREGLFLVHFVSSQLLGSSILLEPVNWTKPSTAVG